MSTFKVGEVVILQNAEQFPEMNGMEATIVAAGVASNSASTGKPFIGFLLDVRNPHGKWCVAQQHQIRKKRPPTTGEESIIAMFRKDKQPKGVEA